jgi:hypothetical protein
MPEKKTVNIIEAIADCKDFHTCVILTYGANLPFYERVVLGQLWQANCKNNLIFMDADRYSETTVDFRDTVGFVGRRYLILPVNLGYLQSFHSKIIYLLGVDRSRLLIGSGNLTFNGYGDNLEIFTQLDWSIKENDFQYLFTKIWQLVKDLHTRWGHSNQALRMLQKAEAMSPWLLSEYSEGNIQLLHSLDAPILDQLVNVIGKATVTRFTIMSPFLDNNAYAIQEIHRKFHPQQIDLILQDGQTVGNTDSLIQLQSKKIPIQFYNFIKTNRYAHAKLYLIETTKETFLATGSPNCTKSGLLSNSSEGNFETLLIQKYKSSVIAKKLLREYVSPEQIAQVASFEIRPHTPIAPGLKSIVQLLDISIESETLSIEFELHSLPKNVHELGLFMSFPKALTVKIPDCEIGINNKKIKISEEDSLLIGTGPRSALICGIDDKDQRIDIHSNSLWITNTAELNQRHLSLSVVDERTGKLLGEMLIGSDADWRDLLDSLNSLVNLDVERVQSIHRGGSAEKPKQSHPANDGNRESRIKIIDNIPNNSYNGEIEAEIYFESRLHSWLEIVFGQFPEERGKINETQTIPSKIRTRPYKPNPNLGKQFVGLVRRYLRAINNPEFIQSVSTYRIIAYFSIFHKIIWLLWKHKVIDDGKFASFVFQINIGFFGNPLDGIVPFALPEAYNHLNTRYLMHWKENSTHLYALASLIFLEDKDMLGDTREILNISIDDLFTHVLSCICPILNPSDLFLEDEISPVALSYGMDKSKFLNKLTKIFKKYSRDVFMRLDEWNNNTSLQMKDVDPESDKTLFLKTTISIGVGSERISKYLNMQDEQINYCTDLIFLATRIEDFELASYYQQQLIELLREKGNLSSLARELMIQGKEFTLKGDYDQAFISLLKAQTIADELLDMSLKKNINIHLSMARFLSKSYQ